MSRLFLMRYERVYNSVSHKKKKYILLIALVGFGYVIFSSVLFNGFALDDVNQIVKNTFIHSIQHIPLFFITSQALPQKTRSFFTVFYRPIPLTVFSLLYTLNRGNAFLTHIFQVTLYLTNVILLFFLFQRFFSKRVAFFLAFIFLIHPLNESMAAYISDLQEDLFFFFGMTALLLLKSSTKRIFLSGLCLLCSLLSKETGILFICITIVYLLLFQKKTLKHYVFIVFMVLGVYSILRVIASLHPFIIVRNSDMLQTSLRERIVFIP